MTGFAAINNDKNIVKKSSSGGIFLCIAYHLIKQNGVCYGAEISQNGFVQHVRVDNEHELDRLCGSKYVRSKCDFNTFDNVKNDLNDGKLVLFSGTPCQIFSLKQYLKSKNVNEDKLFCIQVFCHGTPKPSIFRQYLDEIGFKDDDFISFRYKKPSWRNYSLRIGSTKIKHNKDPYMNLFLSDVSLCESCYKCNCKGFNDFFDLALGDFWGIEKVLPSMNSKFGVSAIISADNQKSRQLIGIITNYCKIEEVEINSILKYNPAFNKSFSKPPYFHEFQLMLLNGYTIKECSKALNKYHKKSIFNRVVAKFKKVL